MRRPSPALIVALVALFFAIGGPAQAKRLIDGSDIKKGTIRSRQIKDRTITTKDISTASLRLLEDTPNASITDAKLAPNAVSATKLAAGAVSAGKVAPNALTGGSVIDGTLGGADLADGSITGSKIADGSLSTSDIARFAGRFRVIPPDLPTILPGTCWSGEPHNLAPENASADISQDALLVTPRTGFDESKLTFSYRTATANASDPSSLSRFVLAMCNVSTQPFVPAATGIAFSYVVFDIP
jgi:hypothetical protein